MWFLSVAQLEMTKTSCDILRQNAALWPRNSCVHPHTQCTGSSLESIWWRFWGEKIIFPIKWGKFVHGEVREFFLQKLIFAVFSTVLSVFRPWHRIYMQLRTNKCITYLKQPYSFTFIWNRWRATERTGTNSVLRPKTQKFPKKRQKSSFADKNSQTSPWTNFHHLGSNFFFFFLKKSSDGFKSTYV
jgi:hypothetical protein